ncbi:MAG TPA: competence/damage-inducible protein A [Vicinamibacterales bacterium]|jgi:nicotinamide-nucleotide amidase
MRAEIIAVGSELLTPLRMDTNSLAITDKLDAIGVEVCIKAVVGDNRADLARMFHHAVNDSDLVILTGGLGPTADDVTREVVAESLGMRLVEDPAILERVRERFTRRGWTMPEINRRQAQVPEGAVALTNRNGTAPGLWIDRPDVMVLLLPGPPRELMPMLEEAIERWLRPRSDAVRLYRRVLKITGRAESHVEEQTQPIYARWAEENPPIVTTILAALGQIELHLNLRSADEARATRRLHDALTSLVEVLGDHVYSTDGRKLEEVVGSLLRERGLRLATAESCTGGLLASRLTDIPGSSDYVDRGVIVYSNQAKVDLLGVPAALIAERGAVSEPVAQAMASGVRERANVEIGVGITGIAGPGGGSDAKPVGTVAIAAAYGERVEVRTFHFMGGREQVKFQATQAALDMVRRLLV